MNNAIRLPVEAFLQHEAKRADEVYLTQPLGGGKLEHLTWRRVGDQARRGAAWLASLQLEPGSRIAIISKNCAHWIIADLAIWMAGHVSVPLYPNISSQAVRQILEHSGASVAFIGKLDDWAAMSSGVPPTVVQVSLPLHPTGAFNFSWEQVQQHARLDTPHIAKPVSVASIIYTSGTTGMPKGVMLSHQNFGFAGTNVIGRANSSVEDRVISYLPLAHVAERLFVELNSLYAGSRVYFTESLETFPADLRRARPTLFFAVPRIWVKFQEKIYSAIPERKLNILLRIPFVGRIIGRKLLEKLGLDAVRYGFSGGAFTPVELINWYRELGLELFEAYGMTENLGYSHTGVLDDFRSGWVGKSNPGVEVKISPEGEVLIRNAAVMQGYFNEPEKTAEALTEEGFLRTGDKGEVDGEGFLRLTGRIKEIFKTTKGKYVAPAPIENKILFSALIDQVCVIGEGLPQPIAICALSINASSISSAEFQRELGALVNGINKQLEKHERISNLVVVDDVWSVENGFLTPTLKIKRAMVDTHYKEHYQHWSTQEQVLFHKPSIRLSQPA